MMNRLLTVDGSNLLFQMFFGMPARIVNGQGKAIKGTFGFTGALLLGEFGTLENILANAERITKPSIRKSVIRNAEKLRINYGLIKLSNTVSLPFALHELAYCYDGMTTNDVLKGIGLR